MFSDVTGLLSANITYLPTLEQCNSASCTPGKEDEVDAILAIEGRRINYKMEHFIYKGEYVNM